MGTWVYIECSLPFNWWLWAVGIARVHCYRTRDCAIFDYILLLILFRFFSFFLSNAFRRNVSSELFEHWLSKSIPVNGLPAPNEIFGIEINSQIVRATCEQQIIKVTLSCIDSRQTYCLRINNLNVLMYCNERSKKAISLMKTHHHGQYVSIAQSAHISVACSVVVWSNRWIRIANHFLESKTIFRLTMPL